MSQTTVRPNLLWANNITALEGDESDYRLTQVSVRPKMEAYRFSYTPKYRFS